LVDARSCDRFDGKVEEPRPGLKKGSIPGSKNIFFRNCINFETNTFKTKSELINIFIEHKVDYCKPAVFTCGSGVTACVLGLAYFLISDKNAVIYDGSFAEWGKK
jgi:thiosulfate/3-mercaptopyruvate sulfurtransferase